MAVLQCKMCGGSLIPVDATVCECDSCGTRQTIPSAGDDKKTNLFNRANRLRMNSEFDKAAAIYEQIVAEYPQEAEAYWGLCLCNYGIEYVDDPATGNKLPTCHRTLTTSIMEDANFEQACDYADTIARKVYRDEAKAIDRIQKDILSIAASEAPYDVFICYKETAEDGGRTEDSVLAQDIYDALTAKGMKVFFSRITLEDKLGVQYEPYIFAALSSAKVMLAIGTAFEYYDAVWVKNEWSRFLSMMKTDKTKTLIPCFKGLDAYDMPKEFKGLQAQDMGKLGWMQDLVRGVMKLCGKGEVATPVQQTVVQQVVQAGSNAEKLMKRVWLFLEDGDAKQAEEYIGKVLDEDAEYAPAYVARVLIHNGLKKESELPNLRKSIDGDADWKKALRFADAQQKQVYVAYAKMINGNENYDVEQARIASEQAQMKAKGERYNGAIAAMNKQSYAGAIVAFNALGDYQDSIENMYKCMDAYRQQLIANEAVKTDPALANAKAKAEQAWCAVNQAQTALNEAEKSKTDTEKRAQAIPEEIRKFSNELAQVRGLFSGGKKRELERNIDALKQEMTGLEQKKQALSTAMQTAKAELQMAEAALVEAKENQAKVEAKWQEQESARWTDDAIFSAAVCDEAFQPGKDVSFGHYPQTRAGTDNTPIKWIVLARDGQKALLISRYGLDAQPYNTSYVDMTWEKCSLRTWLSGTFMNKAFTTAEQGAILLTNVDNSKSQGNSSWITSGGNNTQDKVFLLSYSEANKYFNVTHSDSNNTESRVEPTAYAIKQRADTSSSNMTADGKAAGCWWLRSPGSSSTSAAVVDSNGTCDDYIVNISSGAVRPALWINLESGIF